MQIFSIIQFVFSLFFLSEILTQTIEDEYQEPPPNSTDAQSAYTRNAKKFISQNSVKSGVIVSQFLPIKYNNMDYYWRGYYNYNSNDSLRCDYVLSEADYEFRGVRYQDGSRPYSLKFRCQNNETCCGLECCGTSRSSMFIVGGIIVFFSGVVLGHQQIPKIWKEEEGIFQGYCISTVEWPSEPEGLRIVCVGFYFYF